MILGSGLNIEEDNFSLFRVKPRDVIKGTVCGSNRRDRALQAVAPLVDDTDKRFDEEKKVVVQGENVKEEKRVVVQEETKMEEEEKVVVDEEKKVEEVIIATAEPVTLTTTITEKVGAILL